MKCSISSVTATSFYLLGVVVGSLFGFVAGLLFVIVTFLIKYALTKKERKIDSIPNTVDENHSTTNDGTPSFTA